MSLSPTFASPAHCEDTYQRVAALPLRADAGLNREQALELLAQLNLVRSKLALVEEQYVEARDRLEDAGLIPRR